MGNFSDFKKKSKDSVTFLTSKVEELNSKTSYATDDRFWSLTRDEKTGNGLAIIRFLPAPENEDLPFSRFYSHGFKGPEGKWYYENCPTTIGGKCPVCEENNKLWNSGLDSDKKIARGRKRKLTYVSNIYIIKDPKNPDNEGKCFLYRYGAKIWEKINNSMNPTEEELATDIEPCNPFDFWTGRTFTLKSKLVKTGSESYPNYDDSGFLVASPLLNGDDKQLEALWKKQYPLVPFTDASMFKSYDELRARYNEVLEIPANFTPAPPAASQPARQASKPAPAPSVKKESAPFDTADDIDSALARFKSLSEEE
jgi:hypothetical protein